MTIKNCPFCGGVCDVGIYGPDADGSPYSYYVGCMDDGCGYRGAEKPSEIEATAIHDRMVMGAAANWADECRKLRQWVDDLQSGMYINCVYCGHRYGPRVDTPVPMADVLKEHIEQCPDHPLSTAQKRIAELVSLCDDLLGVVEDYQPGETVLIARADDILISNRPPRETTP